LQNTNLEVLHKLQKRTVRIILEAKYTPSSRSLLYKFNILNIYDICLSYTLRFTYKSMSSPLSTPYSSYFMSLKDMHLHYKRGHKNNIFLWNA